MYWILILISAILAIYWKFSRSHSYWSRKGVSQGEPTPFLGDNWGLFTHTETFAEFSKKLYNRFQNDRYTGIYQFSKAYLMVRDPELFRQITVKDFDHFTDHLSFVADDAEPLWSKNLFSLKGMERYLGLKVFGNKIYTFFTGLIKDTVKFREENSIVRPDLIHLLMEARKGRLQYEEQQSAAKETGFATVEEYSTEINTKIPKREITIDDMTAQALLFFFAGFETISIMMCFLAYEIGVNTDIKEKLREEVDETFRECNGELTYEALNKMKYMDMIMAETLRKWPPVAFADRLCTKKYTIQPTKESEVPVTLEKDDPVWIPVYGIHHDPKYYENPEKFDPERFSDENKANIKPYTYLPFGVGPRNCIGSRFALLEAKALFFHLLVKFEIVPVEKTEIPVNLDKNNFNLNAANGFWFGLKKRNG